MSLKGKTNKKTKKQRADALLVEQSLAPDIKSAQSMIMSGKVYYQTNRVDKPSVMLPDDAVLEYKAKKTHPWVSRGGIKLDHALKHFQIDVNNFIAIDVGASTGGFTDVLLTRNAQKVYSVDVGYGELAWKLRNNDSVVVLERTNARSLNKELIPETPDIIVCDASFTTLSNVLPASLALAADNTKLVSLIKPQFEVKKHEVGTKGIVTDIQLHQRVCDEVQTWLDSNPGWKTINIIESPIKGMEGNTEFLLYAIYHNPSC